MIVTTSNSLATLKGAFIANIYQPASQFSSKVLDHSAFWRSSRVIAHNLVHEGR
jgi:hypothetical protein